MNAPVPIETDEAPPPAGHYSQAVGVGDLIFVSGQLPSRRTARPQATRPLPSRRDFRS